MEESSRKDVTTWLTISYILLFFFPLASIIMAYVKKDEASGDVVLASHVKAQIKIFWISFIVTILGLILAWFIVGFFILLVLFIWLVYRIIKGISQLQANTASAF